MQAFDGTTRQFSTKERFCYETDTKQRKIARSYSSAESGEPSVLTLPGMNYVDTCRVRGKLTHGFLSYDGHAGVDFAFPLGTVVKAAAAGTLTVRRDAYNTVEIAHTNGYTTRYLHMSEVQLCVELSAQGNPCTDGATKQVAAGEAIGKVGDVGAGKNAFHLHFEVVDPAGREVDPYCASRLSSDPSQDRCRGYLWSPDSSVLYDGFDGTTLRTEIWNPVNTVAVSGGLLNLGPASSVNTRGRYEFEGKKIVLEFRMVSSGSMPGIGIVILDVNSPGDWISVQETPYQGFGFTAITLGAFVSPLGQQVILGNYSPVAMEYRVTVEGSSVRFERGASLSQLTLMGTIALGTSIDGRRFYLDLGTNPTTSAGAFDWVRLEVYP